MNRRSNAVLAALAVAALAIACAPTDADMVGKVKANLAADETAKAASIEVGVQKKVVTLAGTVDTPAVRERAVTVARKTDGVTEVVDKLVVKQQRFGPGYVREMMGRAMRSGEPAFDSTAQLCGSESIVHSGLLLAPRGVPSSK